MRTLKEIQNRLNALGFKAGPADGIIGRKTRAAVRAFQRIYGLRVDGDPGPKTQAALWPAIIPERDEDLTLPVLGSDDWPYQHDVVKFFGKAGGSQCTAGQVDLPFKFRIAWNKNQRISRFNCHEKVAIPFERIFNKAHEQYGAQKMRQLGLDLFGGCYNFRKMRGGTRYSMHSWGIAIDLDPVRNQLRWGRDRAQFAKPEYEEFHKIAESEGAINLGRLRNFDWMHWQFANL